MISVSNFHNGTSPHTEIDVEAISEIVQDADAVLWVKVIDPSPEDIAVLDREFNFHYLALEAVTRTDARPEIDFYDTFLYMNFYGIDQDGGEELFRPQMISFFVGANFLVTVLNKPLQLFDEIHENWERSTTEAGRRDIGLLLYSVLDAIVDSYFGAIDMLSEEIDQLENEVFGQGTGSELQHLFDIKKATMTFRRFVAPERDVLNALLRWDSPLVERQTIIYLQDVYDHLLRVIDSLDNYRDLLSSVLEAHLSMTSNRLNQTMKTLTASSIILMSMTLVAGIYGMNFVHMPELAWDWGYWWALGIMGVVGISLVTLFRRINWI